MDPLLAAWRHLESARTVSLLVRDPETGAVQAQGTAEVTVEITGGWEMVLRERGRWTGPRGAGAHFTDALRWTLDTDMAVLRLEHVRHGVDEPVPLLELVHDGAASLTPVAPYQCAEDRYEGAVQVVAGGVEVAWKVTGPRKRQEILRHYR